jgi:hypothetical protein
MTRSAFEACFSDFRIVKGRKVGQLIFELPLEAVDAALETLGGVPRPDKEAWVGIARLEASSVRKQLEASVALIDKAPSKERRAWSQLSYAEQAGIRCNEPAFWQFLSEEVDIVSDPEEAANAVRVHCGVGSRSQIKAGSIPGHSWQSLDASYEAWLRRPTF